MQGHQGGYTEVRGKGEDNRVRAESVSAQGCWCKGSKCKLLSSCRLKELSMQSVPATLEQATKQNSKFCPKHAVKSSHDSHGETG